LQLLASHLAATLLTASGVGVIRDGNVLDVAGHRTAVAEACNGVRYLLSLGFMGVVFGYLFDPKPWIRAALLLAAVPLAILANAARVAAAAYLPALDSGVPHILLGWVIFVLCLPMLAWLRRLVNAAYLVCHA
jgi:exosortase